MLNFFKAPDTVAKDLADLLVPSEDPDRIGPYRLTRLLGEGGMARVYVAEFEDENIPERYYALKLLRPLGHDEEEFEARFQREIRLGLKVRHPNVCRVVDWGMELGKLYYLVMELLRGESLAQYVAREAPMDAGESLRIMAQILQGLEAVHRAGIVHRDLKPGNVFVTDEGVVKIMDFGIARSHGCATLTEPGSVLGTLHFISPEQLDDTRHVDLRSDLFSCGLIGYVMLSGRFPMDCDSLNSLAQYLMVGPLEPLSNYRSDLPAGIHRWLDGLLALDRERRFPSARAALEAMPTGL